MTTTLHRPVAGLDQVRAFLDQGHPDKALDALNKMRDHSPPAANARAVCLMRLGHADQAVSIYRSMLLASGVIIRENAPVTYVVNFATALLLAGNPAGAVATLDDLHQPDHPSAVRLRGAIARWRKSLGFKRRLLLAVTGDAPGEPVRLDFPPGEL